MQNIVLSYLQAQEILTAYQANQDSVMVSLDLGLTTDKVIFESAGVYLPYDQILTFETLELICESPRSCFILGEDGPRKIQIFSEVDNKVYSLMPTSGAPTLLVSGMSMHRIKGIDPRGDAVKKVKSVAPITGSVLDTATGLGYTAIESAKTTERVITVELSPTSLEIARLNPWSQPLFGNSNITQIIGDSFEEIQAFDNEQFTRIIHDPPSFSMAGELYSGEFYRQMFRVLQRKGRLFHYIGDLDSKSGRNSAIAKGVIRRLGEAGFSRVVRRPRAFGVAAYK